MHEPQKTRGLPVRPADEEQEKRSRRRGSSLYTEGYRGERGRLTKEAGATVRTLHGAETILKSDSFAHGKKLINMKGGREGRASAKEQGFYLGTWVPGVSMVKNNL